MLLMGTPFRFIAHFWEYGIFAYLLPAAFLVAALLQCLLFHGKKRTWLPAVVCFGGLAACEIVFQILAALATGKLNLGAAFIYSVSGVLSTVGPAGFCRRVAAEPAVEKHDPT